MKSVQDLNEKAGAVLTVVRWRLRQDVGMNPSIPGASLPKDAKARPHRPISVLANASRSESPNASHFPHLHPQ